MQGYLSGRGVKSDSKGGIKPSFRPFLEKNTNEHASLKNQDDDSSLDQKTEVIYDQANCPKVEVVTENDIPQKIVIYLEDGRLLTIGCEY